MITSFFCSFLLEKLRIASIDQGKKKECVITTKRAATTKTAYLKVAAVGVLHRSWSNSGDLISGMKEVEHGEGRWKQDLPSTHSIPNHQRWYAKWKLSRNMYTLRTRFLARLAPICMLSRCSLTKFLHWSSGGSLLRVRCWLGSGTLIFTKTSIW